jgi:hypothetical protein
MNRVVQIGDHDPEWSVTPRRRDELFAIRKTEWSLAEYRALSDRLADAVQAFQIAIANESLSGIRSATATFDEIAEQLRFLTTGLHHAADSVTQPQQEFRR